MILVLVVVVRSTNDAMAVLPNDLNPSQKKEFSWILKDKYGLSDLVINKIFLNEANLSFDQFTDLSRLLSGEPVNYIIGWATFLNCKIFLDKRPLIPRPETEFWVQDLILRYPKKSKLSILDLGCGSGCIGIALLKNLPYSRVDFVDIVPKFLEQTLYNLRANKINASRYKVIKSNLFDNVPIKKYDLVVTNPPYVSLDYKNPSLDWEPHQALFASKKGLKVIEDIVKSISPYLKKRSNVFMEFSGSIEQKRFLEIILKDNNFKYTFYRDQYKKWRWVKFYEYNSSSS